MKSVYLIGAALIGNVGATGLNAGSDPQLHIDASQLPPVHVTDSRYQSYTIDMASIAGVPPLRPAKNVSEARAHTVLSGVSGTKPINMKNARLRKLAKALGPAYFRASGTPANSVYFQDNDRSALAAPPEGYGYLLTRPLWRDVLGFAKAADAKILTSFTVNTEVRDKDGVWTPRMAGPLIDYTRKLGGSIYAAELFNEPNLPSYGGVPKGYDSQSFGRDQVAFRAFAKLKAPAMKLVGPGAVIVANHFVPGSIPPEQLMQSDPPPKFDIISYHYYPAVAARCAPPTSPVGTTAEAALSEAFLDSTDKSFLDHKALRDRFAPGAPIWNTETGGAACAGSVWSATFLDSFRYLDQLGRLAKQGADVIFHQTLVGGNYGMLEPDSFQPRPNYWSAVLWRRLMGAKVLDAGKSQPGLRLYAHCLRGQSGGVALLAINLTAASIAIGVSGPANLYALTAPDLQSKTALLDGKPLALKANDTLPPMQPTRREGQPIMLAPTSISFIAQPNAHNPEC